MQVTPTKTLPKCTINKITASQIIFFITSQTFFTETKNVNGDFPVSIYCIITMPATYTKTLPRCMINKNTAS